MIELLRTRGRSMCGRGVRTWCLLVVPVVALVGCMPITLSTIFLRPTPDVVGLPDDYGFTDYEEVMVPVADERAVSIWHVHADDPKGIVVIIPGSDRNKARYLVGLPVFVPNGYDTILMDYEGFGDSTGGLLDLARLTEDGQAVLEYAQTQHENVIAFGISTGGPTATWCAAKMDLAAVILEAPLVLADEVELWLRNQEVEEAVLWDVANLWVHPQIPDSFDILKWIAFVDEPKLIMQSTEDDTVPFDAGESVFAAASEPKEFFELRGDHGEMVELDPTAYSATIIGWLDQVLGVE